MIRKFNSFLSSPEWLRSFAWLARVSLFVVYFWFGLLKLLGLSPAEQLVQDLFSTTIGFMSFETFYVLFSLFEILIGILFLIPKATRLVFVLFIFHMVMTTGPLVLLPQSSWNVFLLVPTLTGQYIIKNLALLACAVGVLGFYNTDRARP